MCDERDRTRRRTGAGGYGERPVRSRPDRPGRHELRPSLTATVEWHGRQVDGRDWHEIFSGLVKYEDDWFHYAAEYFLAEDNTVSRGPDAKEGRP